MAGTHGRHKPADSEGEGPPDVQGVILAAGEGTRLRAVAGERPKPLLEVGGRSLLEHALACLVDLDADELVLVVGHGATAIRERCGEAFGDRRIVYAPQRERRGLAHAVLTAEPHVDGPFVAMHGDNFFSAGAATLRPVVERRDAEELAASLLVERVPAERATAGVCEVGPDGRVRRLVEHPRPDERRAGLVVAGFYAFDPVVFRACRAIRASVRGEYELPDAVTWLVRRGHPVAATPLRGARVNVNTPDDLERARALAREPDAAGP